VKIGRELGKIPSSQDDITFFVSRRILTGKLSLRRIESFLFAFHLPPSVPESDYGQDQYTGFSAGHGQLKGVARPDQH